MTCIAAVLFRFIGDDVAHHIVLTELAAWFAVGFQHLHDNRADLIGSDHVDERARPGEVVAGVTLIFTGRYPQGIFDLMIELNRWVYRVVAYAALMTDDYPPFRLDTGGTEPGTGSGNRIPSPDPT